MYNATSIMLLWIFISPLQYFSQPRILMAMARDGLLPSFFSDVHKTTQVPVKSTIVTGICAASLAFFMDVSQLAGMV
jgi:cationic amino acid transporter 1